MTAEDILRQMKEIEKRKEEGLRADVGFRTVDMLEEILQYTFPDSVWDDSPRRTAERIISYWREYNRDAGVFDFNVTTFPTQVNQMITVNNIEFSSMCAHHLLPFFGIAHVAYIPNKLAIGLSKIPRIVKHFAKKPTTQEKMTAEIASYLKSTLEAMGVAVVVSARHTCMACRGILQHNGHMTTSEMRGVFLTAAAARNEFISLIDTKVHL